MQFLEISVSVWQGLFSEKMIFIFTAFLSLLIFLSLFVYIMKIWNPQKFDTDRLQTPALEDHKGKMKPKNLNDVEEMNFIFEKPFS